MKGGPCGGAGAKARKNELEQNEMQGGLCKEKKKKDKKIKRKNVNVREGKPSSYLALDSLWGSR